MTVIIEMLSSLPNQVLNNASPELFRLIDILDVAANSVSYSARLRVISTRI